MVVCREAVTWVQLSKMFCKNCLRIITEVELTGQEVRFLGYTAMAAAELSLKAYMLSHEHWPCSMYEGYKLMEECRLIGFPVNSMFDESMKKMPADKEVFLCATVPVGVKEVVEFASSVIEFTKDLWEWYVPFVLEYIKDAPGSYELSIPEDVVLTLPEAPRFDK